MRAAHQLIRQQYAAALRRRVDEICVPMAITSLLEHTSTPLQPQQQQRRGLQIFEVRCRIHLTWGMLMYCISANLPFLLVGKHSLCNEPI